MKAQLRPQLPGRGRKQAPKLPTKTGDTPASQPPEGKPGGRKAAVAGLRARLAGRKKLPGKAAS